MCRLLGVSPSGFYAWLTRPKSRRELEDERLTEKIREFHKASRETYGALKILADFKEAGIAISKKRIRRLMKNAGIAGITRRRWICTTERDLFARPAPDLVQRNFEATKPNDLWVADITYIPTWTGFLYLSVVMDAFSRKIVGWCMATHLRAELVVDALQMAVHQRRPESVVHHSDQGCQYTSIAFGLRCKEANVRPSMGSVGDAYDNAMCESFFATLEWELLDRRRFKNQVEARMAVFEFIEGWYNPRRRHQSLDYASPMKYEERYQAAT